MFTSSGRHIEINGNRFCKSCHAVTEQVCYKIRYQENPDQQKVLFKKSYWICQSCVSESEEFVLQQLPSDKVRIINRLLNMQKDYAISSMKIASAQKTLTIEIQIDEARD